MGLKSVGKDAILEADLSIIALLYQLFANDRDSFDACVTGIFVRNFSAKSLYV